MQGDKGIGVIFWVRNVIHSVARHKKNGSSLQNCANVNASRTEITNLLNYGIEPGHVTVLTMYRGQTKLIVQKVRSMILRDGREIQKLFSEATTVDSYQGKENEVIILDIVAANPKTVNNLAIQSIA